MGVRLCALEGVARALTAVTGSAQFDISSNGTLVYLPGPARSSTERPLAVSDRDGNVTRLSAAPGPYEHVRVSRDGRRLVIGTERDGEGRLWIYPVDGKGPMQRLPLPGRSTAPIWSPDGLQLALQSDVERDRAVFIVHEDGTGLSVSRRQPRVKRIRLNRGRRMAARFRFQRRRTAAICCAR